VENFMKNEGKTKKPSSHMDGLNFASFLINCWTYMAEISNWVLPPWALMTP
jgi:hypothetical protein